MKRYYLFVVIAIVAMSCKTQSLYLNVTQPAPVTVPAYVKKVGVIDRTSPSAEAKRLDDLDKVLTLEGSDLDSLGKIGSIAGLTDELLTNDRFNSVTDLSSINFRTSAVLTFPDPLSWQIVQSVCDENDVDAVFALEYYDTDTQIHYNATEETKKAPLLSVLLEPNSSIETVVKTGWRIYEPQQQSILDEYVITRSIVSSGSLASTAIALKTRKDAVTRVSNETGHAYAVRLLPYDISVTRDYYVKGTQNFVMARRKAQNGKWDEAGALWEKEVTNNKGDIAGRACYNMAIINEINGNLEEAIKWAEKSYEDYGNKLARDYARVLKNRRNSAELLKIQEER